MTNLLQSADVCWMRPLKLDYFCKWNERLVNSPKTYTAAGNMRSPGYASVINWINKIWSDFDPNLLARSFDHCKKKLGLGFKPRFNLDSNENPIWFQI